MATNQTIKPRRGTSAPGTGAINQNELAIDTTNKRIYIGAADGSGTLIGSAPGGSNTQVQFNDSGNLGGDSGLTYDKTTDSLTITGDLAVNGADITTTSTGTATLFNTNATTVNIGGAGTTVSIGAATGTTTINNANTVVTGDLAVNGGDVTTSSASATVFNSTATTLSIGGAATTFNIGGASSATINLGKTDGTTVVDMNSCVLREVEMRSYFETEGTVTYTGGMTQDLSFDLSTGNVFVYTTTGSITTFTVTNVPSKANTAVGFTVVLTCGNALYSVTFDAFTSGGPVWAGGTPPTASSTLGRTDIVSYVTYDAGTTWYGMVGGLNFF